jgi:hypothetical protein
MPNRLDLLRARYLRNTTAKRDGALGHHGDCLIYGAGTPICNCGLLHDLDVIAPDQAESFYPKYHEDKRLQEGILAHLLEVRFNVTAKTEGKEDHPPIADPSPGIDPQG